MGRRGAEGCGLHGAHPGLLPPALGAQGLQEVSSAEGLAALGQPGGGELGGESWGQESRAAESGWGNVEKASNATPRGLMLQGSAGPVTCSSEEWAWA